MIELSRDQEKALRILLKWLKTAGIESEGSAKHDAIRSSTAQPQSNQYITMGGYAGTGKTTLIAILRKLIKSKLAPKLGVAFCSYTGRAVQIMKNKLIEEGALYGPDKISTIHGLIYEPIENSNAEIVGWRPKDDVEDVDLIIVDEASMISREIWDDLLRYRIPIIAVGDHGQLPPIGDKFNLMKEPHISLEQIHRQARDNPIIKVATIARTQGKVPIEVFNAFVAKHSREDPETGYIIEELLDSYDLDTIILCGYNNTRNKINQAIRIKRGFETEEPSVGDRVICLRNNHKKQIYNGMLGTIEYIAERGENGYEVEIEMDDSSYKYTGQIYKPQFGAPSAINFTENRRLIGERDLFDFGYALTVHKAQGSQARKVIMFEERFKQMDDEMWKRWLYTGITRASEELILIGN
jgi:exodeoxyribonuclease-5